jgi:hypothetical protein
MDKLAKVLAFIWRFDRVNRPLIERTRVAHGADVPVLRLAGRRDVAAFLSSCGDKAADQASN